MSKSRRGISCIGSMVVAFSLLTVSACSDDSGGSGDSSESESTQDDSASDDSASDSASDDSASDASADTAAAEPDAAETTAADEVDEDVADDGGDCSDVPSEAEVEAVIGMALLPVEYSEFTGCAYSGDGNNAGVYFERQTSEEDLAHFASPDPAFAEPVTDPELAGAFIESGDLYASKDGVVFAVFAGVTGTDADDGLAIELMKLWLANV